MKKTLCMLSALVCVSAFPQHIPHKIDNQWHYDMSLSPGGIDYAAIAKERVVINNIEYWQIDRMNSLTGELIETMYDRMEGDSLYIRKVACPEELIINFNWPVGHIEVTALGSECFAFKKLVNKFQRDLFGVSTLSYQFMTGQYCEGYADTAWNLFMPEITKDFGCYWADDGKLVGALINGQTYGILYPLPVELISFTARQNGMAVLLKWQTASELNNAGYEILRKKYENTGWEKAAFIEGKGTTSEVQYYSFSDADVQAGTWFYRILQHDYDGTKKLIAETPVDFISSPGKFLLRQNYPNPFNPSTVIEYHLDKDSDVKLTVYDIMGREVTTLVNEFKTAGIYKVNFTGSEISSGMYIYTLKSEGRILSRQMMLVK